MLHLAAKCGGIIGTPYATNIQVLITVTMGRMYNNILCSIGIIAEKFAASKLIKIKNKQKLAAMKYRIVGHFKKNEWNSIQQIKN